MPYLDVGFGATDNDTLMAINIVVCILVFINYLYCFLISILIYHVLDAELLLLTLPFVQVLSTKKVPLNDILKFLILKGLKPTTNLNRSSLCLAFKTLIESQPDFSKPLVQFQSTSQFQMTADNMLALAQNNNMNCQPYQIVSSVSRAKLQYHNIHFYFKRKLYLAVIKIKKLNS